MDQQIATMLQLGVIVECQTDLYSQAHLVLKPDKESWRFCIDFRGLNKATKSKCWPIPNIDDMLQRIGANRAKYFASMDLTAGYHQVALDEESSWYTAFITPSGLYRWLRVPMGLKGAGAYFTQMICSEVLRELLHNNLEAYFDDLLHMATTHDEFLSGLRKLFARLRAHRITLNPKKCKFGIRAVEFVGHLIDETGVRFSEEKILRVLNFDLPQSVKQLQSFVGTINYFKQHIRDFANLAAPLHALVANRKGHETIAWDSELIECFHHLRTLVQNLPKLFFIDGVSPVFLYTDACDTGIGAYLYQVVDGVEQPIAFLSFSLKGAQLRWAVVEKEQYAIVYAFKKLRYLIRDIYFTLCTDHLNLTREPSDPYGKVYRWMLTIQEFDFQVLHVAGRDNVVADGLSRLCALDDVIAIADAETGTARYLCRHVQPITSLCASAAADAKYLEMYPLLECVHSRFNGHLGINATVSKLRTLGYQWDGMTAHVERYISVCPVCQKNQAKAPGSHGDPFVVSTTAPMEVVAVDTIVGLPTTKEGNTCIIVMIDTFTRFVELRPCPNLTAESAATALVNFCCRYGTPKALLTDNGGQFISDMVAVFCKRAGIAHKTILAYSHQENAIVERVNNEVVRHVRNCVIEQRNREDWDLQVPFAQRIINSSVHSSTGFAPQELVFGKRFSLNRHLVPQDHNLLDETKETMDSWNVRMTQLYNETVSAAALTQAQLQVAHLEAQTTASTVFDDGSLVLLSYHRSKYHPGVPSKIHPLLQGPYRVVRHWQNTYTIESLVNGRIWEIHVSRLRLYRMDVTPDGKGLTPTEVSLVDEQFYTIEFVVSHTFDGGAHTLSNLSFKVHWLGYTSDEDSYVEWAAVRYNQVVHAYMRGVASLRKIMPQGLLTQAKPDAPVPARSNPQRNKRKRADP